MFYFRLEELALINWYDGKPLNKITLDFISFGIFSTPAYIFDLIKREFINSQFTEKILRLK